MRCGVERPGHDAWVGVGIEVLRYVRALEMEIEAAGVKLEIARLEYADELKNLRKTVASKDREIRRVGDELKLAIERLGLGSANSSKPPSTDGLGAPKRAVRLATGKRRGGRPRHPFHARALVETAACATGSVPRMRRDIDGGRPRAAAPSDRGTAAARTSRRRTSAAQPAVREARSGQPRDAAGWRARSGTWSRC